MSERVVVRGRFFADGMWLTHLLWACMTLPFLAIGLCACWVSIAGTKGTGTLGSLFLGVLFMLVGLGMLSVWKMASYSITLKPDGLWCRPGLMKSVFIPYGDMVFLGATKAGFVLAYERQRRDGRVSARLHLPPWSVGSRVLRGELQLRAPHMKMTDEAENRLWAFRNRMGLLASVWMLMLVPLLVLSLMLRPEGSPVSKDALILAGALWVAVLVGLFVWQTTGERRITK